MPPEDVAGWFDQMMAVNRRAFAAGHYEAAYHALLAALHFAQDLHDAPRLRDVARVAGEQRDGIDAQAPKHRLSSQVADKRGHENIFGVAQRQAETRARLVGRRRPTEA